VQKKENLRGRGKEGKGYGEGAPKKFPNGNGERKEIGQHRGASLKDLEGARKMRPGVEGQGQKKEAQQKQKERRKDRYYSGGSPNAAEKRSTLQSARRKSVLVKKIQPCR